MGDRKSSPEYARLTEGLIGSRGQGETGFGLLDVTPAGIPLGVNDAWHKGDDRGMAMAIFGGPMAKTADRVALKTAEEMAAKGLTREQIFKDTGWFRGVDGKWRFEIDDSGAKMAPDEKWSRPWKTYDPMDGWRIEPPSVSAAKSIGANTIVGDRGIMTHADLTAAYPSVKEIRLDVQNGLGGRYTPSSKGNVPRISLNGDLDKTEAKSLGLHELQHDLQRQENFGVGGVSFDAAYNRLAGEVEARAVQKRMDLTPDQRRARPPWLDYDVPEQDQIVRFGGSGPQMSMEPPPGIRAYHGSPHDFDKFDISKIGTGEGAQAFGPGLYFAEKEGIAKSYRDKLRKTTVDGNPYSSRTPEGVASQAEHISGGDVEKAKKYLQSNIDFAGHPQELRDLHKQALDLLESKGFPNTVREPGHMYEVSINAHPDDFLDWDKPLSQQSEKVQRIVSKFGDGVTSGDPLGQDILQSKLPFALRYDHDIKGIPHDKLGGLALKEAGIPGVRYLDAGSRTAGEGSRNYVVFDDKIIDIVKKYGIAAAVSLYGLDAVNNATGAAMLPPDSKRDLMSN